MTAVSFAASLARIAALPSVGAGRWMYCKGCYKHVLPLRNVQANAHRITWHPMAYPCFDGSLIVCSECGYGLQCYEHWLSGYRELSGATLQ